MNKKFLFIILLIFFSYQLCHSKVDPPNYDFSLDKLTVVYPGKNLDDIEKQFKNIILVSKDDDVFTYKIYVAHIRYKFPVFINVYNKKVLEFWANLPSYFLHDVFYQSLINRMGKPNNYKNIEINSVYIWDNFNGNKFVYSGSCTITCFPVYLYGITSKLPNEFKKYESLMDKAMIKP